MRQRIGMGRGRRGLRVGPCRRVLGVAAVLLLAATSAQVRSAPTEQMAVMQAWFEQFKVEASAEQLYRFLYAMPKGGDLHNHLSGSLRPEWLYEIALAQRERGYRFYTRVRINNCRPYGADAFGPDPYLLLFLTIQHSHYQTLSPCEQSEYVALEQLDAEQKAGWLNSLRLDQAHEGREEFFQTHWQRMNHLYANPYVAADGLVRNMQEFAQEGLRYLESMIGVAGFIRPDGSPFSMNEVAQIYRDRLQQPDAQATGVAVRLQVAILRFAPNAEEMLRAHYTFVAQNSDLFVAVNMVGREDNDKGHPRRFLPVLRELRRQYHGVRLSIHAGEVDEPNNHVRDTLLLGADRIGHGLNLITDEDTLRRMRHGPYLVEINLISNLLLEYVDDYQQHPFPEYLRMGVPVALSTDDRGMWDSNLSDEFYVAVREFNLSWAELVQLSRNSLQYSFAPPLLKAQLLDDLEQRLEAFMQRALSDPAAVLADNAISYGFSCRRYQLCNWPAPLNP